MRKNSLLLVISTPASLDTLEIAEWYEKQTSSLGDKFLDELHQSYNNILSFPEACGWFNKDKNIRKCRLPHFPYHIFYLIEKSEIRIITIIHSSRSTRFVKRHLK